MILCLDPGISAANATGVSLFNPAIKRLVATDVIRRNASLEGLDAQLDIAEKVIEWAGQGVRVFVTEWPQVYPHEREKDPNKSLLPLCGIIGAVSGLLRPDVTRVMYLPREWKGTIPGDAFCDRIVERLDPRERGLLGLVMPAGLRHNATDSVGLGLHYLGRMGRTRAVHNE